MGQELRTTLLTFYILLMLGGQSCNSPTSPVTYRTSNNDMAEIRLTLNPDKTLDFYFKSFDEPDSLDSNDARETVFESRGTWQTVDDKIEVTFKKSNKDFNYRVIFENTKNTTVIINDSTFRFDKNKEMIQLWGIDSPKN